MKKGPRAEARGIFLSQLKVKIRAQVRYQVE